MRRAIYPGSFDPITAGHIDIISRVAPLFDELIVLVASSLKKQYFFSEEERLEMVFQSVSPIGSVKVEIFNGLTVDFAKQREASVIIRGIRSANDLEYEMTIAQMNKRLNSSVETMIMLASSNTACISSQIVKEIVSYGGPLDGLVPDAVAVALENKFKAKDK